MISIDLLYRSIKSLFSQNLETEVRTCFSKCYFVNKTFTFVILLLYSENYFSPVTLNFPESRVEKANIESLKLQGL